MTASEPEGTPKRSPRDPLRVQRALATLGVVALGLLFVALVVVADVALTSLRRRPPAEPAHGALSLSLVTRAGLPVGARASGGVEFMLSPVSFYEHRPSQPRHQINALGLRGREVAQRPSRPRVIVVGGSAAFGAGVAARETFVALLGLELPQAEILNAAVMGYTSLQELALATHRLVALEPSAIVSFSGWNDLYDAWWRALTPHSATRASAQSFDPLESSNFEELENRLARYRLLEERPSLALLEAFGALARRSTLLSGLSRALASPPATPVPPELGADWVARVADAYAANLATLRDLLAGRGARLLVVLQPELAQVAARASVESMRQHWGGEDYAPGDRYWEHFPALYRSFRAQAAARLERAGVTRLDASEGLGDPRRALVFFFDPVHLSVEGHRRIAALLRPATAKLVTPN